MPLIIDCYNLLHVDMPAALAGLDTGRLCRLLATSAWVGEQMTVVCDGVANPLGLTASPVDTVQLVYAGGGRTADEVIIDMIDRNTAPRRLTVVSSDWQIRKAARRRRATDMPSDQFVGELLKAMQRRGGATPTNKPSQTLGDGEVDDWLDQFGIGK